jgi:outer membrane protein OmpA-like peptidoglycan-associated protein
MIKKIGLVFCLFILVFKINAQSTLKNLIGEPYEISLQGGNGLIMKFYKNNFNTLIDSTIVSKIDFNWKNKKPHSKLKKHDFYIHWQGNLYAPASGVYVFHIQADDGIKFWLNDELLLNSWKIQPLQQHQIKVFLEGQKLYKLLIEYADFEQKAQCKFLWQYQDFPISVVSQEFLFHHLENILPKKEKIKLENKENNSQLFDYQSLKKGNTIVLSQVSFEQSSFILKECSFETLQALAKVLKEHQTLKILIIGHTDNVGNAKQNQILSEKRALSVKEYLLNQGIETSRIQTQGVGGTKPVASNASEDERKKNRRVEIFIQEE